MSVAPHSEAAFETVIEAHLLAHGYVSLPREGFDRERAIFPDTALAFIRETQPTQWARLESLLGDRNRQADPRRPVQVDGRPRFARHVATRI